MPYPYKGDDMLEAKMEIILSEDERKKLNSNIKTGIYKELYAKELLTEGELSFLMEREKRIIGR